MFVQEWFNFGKIVIFALTTKEKTFSFKIIYTLIIPYQIHEYSDIRMVKWSNTIKRLDIWIVRWLNSIRYSNIQTHRDEDTSIILVQKLIETRFWILGWQNDRIHNNTVPAKDKKLRYNNKDYLCNHDPNNDN